MKRERDDEAKPLWAQVKERADLTDYVMSRFKPLIRAHVEEVALERTVDGELWVYTRFRARRGGSKRVRHRSYLAGLENAPMHLCVKAYVEMDTYGWLMVTDIIRKRVARPIAKLHEALHAGQRGDPLPEKEEESVLRRMQIEAARRSKKRQPPRPGPGGDEGGDGGTYCDDDDDDGIPF